MSEVAAKAIALPSMLPVLCPVAFIQDTVALSYGIHPRLMRHPSRDRAAAWPRQVAMYLARKLTKKSLPQIGRVFGNRDHSTVCYAIKAVEGRMEDEPLYRADVEMLLAALSPKPVNIGDTPAFPLSNSPEDGKEHSGNTQEQRLAA